MSFSNLHVIIGLGATGFSCVRYLATQGIPIAVTDTRENPPFLTALQKTYPDVPVKLGNLDAALLEKAATLVISPGLALNTPGIAEQIKRGVSVVGDIELFARAVRAPVIAITGTNAKSTVTTLVGEMAKAAGYRVQVGGNLGVPVLDLLADNPTAELFVLELSSFQLETTSSLAPQVATVLNITPDHMDRYHDLAEYQAAKHRIYTHCQIAVCNRDDLLTDCKSSSLQRKLLFTLDKPGHEEWGLLTKANNVYLSFENQPLLAISELPVKGRHYQANALAALAMGHGFGLPLEVMLQVLRDFKGLPHRCQFIRERNGAGWYNDSKGTNVGATLAAIEGLGSEIKGKLILIAGGVPKNADFTPLAPVLEKYVRHVVLIGEAAPLLSNVIGHGVATSFAKNMEEAVWQADHAVKPDDCVLLSPACASFDMFNNYEHRGEVFMEIVRGME